METESEGDVEVKPYNFSDTTLAVSALLSRGSIEFPGEDESEESMDLELTTVDIAMKPTNELLDMMFAYASIGLDNLTPNQDATRHLVACELKARAADGSL